MGSNITSSAAGGNIMFNTSTEEVDINIGTNGPWSQMQRVAHEFKHADQYLNRKISFDAT